MLLLLRACARLRALLAFFQNGKLRIGRKVSLSPAARLWFHKGRIIIGDRSKLLFGAYVDAQRGSVEIGRNVSLNPYVVILGAGGVKIGNDVRIAPHASIVSFDHVFADRARAITTQGLRLMPVEIGDDVWIGDGAKILGGSRIASGCIIGANAVVKGETMPYGIYVGSPARLLRLRGDGAGRTES